MTEPEPPHETLRRAAKTQQGPSSVLLMALADEMADYPAVLVPNGVGLAIQPNRPSAVWTTAYQLALHCLGEERPT